MFDKKTIQVFFWHVGNRRAHKIVTFLFFSRPPPQIKEIGCYVPGECTGGALYVALSDQPDASSCHQQCIDADGCLYFTYYSGDSTCFSYSTCPVFSEGDCDDCTSGDVTCQLEEASVRWGKIIFNKNIESVEKKTDIVLSQQCINILYVL